MSGGVAYVYDPTDRLAKRLNTEELVDLELLDAEDEKFLSETIARHAELTGSGCGD